MKPSGISDAEWQARQDLAACYRLIAHYRMTDIIYTHVSARIPGEHEAILINPYGMMFHEIRASDLVRVDLFGNPVQESDAPINRAGFFIHSAVHEARPDLACVIHTHTTAGIAVAAQQAGLLMISQHAARFHRRVSYHDYLGIADDDAERKRLARDLGDNVVMLLRNHGILACGRSIPEAFIDMHYLERACQAQVAAMAGGAPLHILSDEVAAQTARGFDRARERRKTADGRTYTLEWAALTRMLDQADTSWRD
ncbi:class II aldolase/adducin family protein [Xenophilus azovorans]|uniref:class II aldolase/adducin family protein n=1 Tax=Xenophilus azovorans TaxID=151755 RepID=UPI000571FF3B|nr:class II aldolase/adducin family protein [Xenophilus azovorans]